MLYITFYFLQFLIRSLKTGIKQFNSLIHPIIILCLLIVIRIIYFKTKFETDHFVIVSATYYKTSPIYKPDTVIVLINGPDQYNVRNIFFCVSKNVKGEFSYLFGKIRYAYVPVGVCKWTTYIIECQVKNDLESFYLSHSMISKKAKIPLRLPYESPIKNKKIEVVNCFSPFFYNEHWQLILTSLELYRHFGSQLQVYYVQSMLESITDVLKKYREEGLIELEPWASFKLGLEALDEIGFDPNFELDWRNQASAHTDCFLKYRSVAQFIIFGDVDDVLLPKLGLSYIKEFEFLSNIHSNAAGFTYNRYNTALKSNRYIKHFSLENSLNSAYVSNELEDGKYVVNTSRVETAWLHYPGIYNRKTLQMFKIPESQNIMIHLRNWTILQTIHKNKLNTKTEIAAKGIKLYKIQLNDIINNESINAIEKEFRTFSNKYFDVFNKLPTKNYYLPLIIACYDRIFYSLARHPDSCPGPLKCQIPAIENLNCTVAVRKFTPKKFNYRTKLYVSQNEGQFLSSKNGCYLG